MAYPRQIRNFNAFLDGISYFGRTTEAKLPDVKIKTAAHRGAGMDGTIGVDMGLEAMSADVTFAEWRRELLTKVGLTQRMVLRPAQTGEGDFTADTIIATIGGLFTMHEFGGLKPGEASTLKLTCDVRYYRLEMNGAELYEIDLEQGRRIIGGVDQLRDIRRAMGL